MTWLTDFLAVLSFNDDDDSFLLIRRLTSGCDGVVSELDNGVSVLEDGILSELVGVLLGIDGSGFSVCVAISRVTARFFDKICRKNCSVMKGGDNCSEPPCRCRWILSLIHI